MPTGRPSDTERERDAACEDARATFWGALTDLAVDVFGLGSDVFSEGRSGGWAVPYGPGRKAYTLADVEEDAGLRRKCAAFLRKAEAMLRHVEEEYVAPAVLDRLRMEREARAERRAEYHDARKAWNVRAAALRYLAHALRTTPACALPGDVRAGLADAGLWGQDPEEIAGYMIREIGQPPAPPPRRKPRE